MIVMFGGTKGGAGKSTLAANLAAYLTLAGRDVLLLDADHRQHSAAGWAQQRVDAGLPTVHCLCRTGDIREALRDVAQRYDEIIVDVGGHDSKELRAGMLLADRVYVPLRPSQFDLWTLDPVVTLAEESRMINPSLRVTAILTQAPTNPRVRALADATEFIAGRPELDRSAATIHLRQVYADTVPEGKSVFEGHNEKAQAEIQTLAHEVYGAELQILARPAA